jgi:dihydroorotase
LTRGKKRFGIAEHSIEVGATADLSLFTPSGTQEITRASLLSTSKNSLFIGTALPGKVYGIVAQGKSQVHNS